MNTFFLAVICLAVLSNALKSSREDNGFRLPLGRTHKYRRQRGVSPLSAGESSVHGSVWPTSVFYTMIEVGTPPTKFAVSIDSGSDALYLSGVNCTGCVSDYPNTPYMPSNSSSSVDLHQRFSAFYGTCDPTNDAAFCSINGSRYSDLVSLGGVGPAMVELGVIEQQSTDFYQFQTIDGIMGMVGYTNKSVFNQLCRGRSSSSGGGNSSSYYCQEATWGICMNHGAGLNGTLTIGGVDESLSLEPLVYLPSNGTKNANPSSMSGSFREVKVNSLGISLGLGGGVKESVVLLMHNASEGSQHAILDTGTNNLLVPGFLYSGLQDVLCGGGPGVGLKHCDEFFLSQSGKPLPKNTSLSDYCFPLTAEEISAYPNISVRLDKNGQDSSDGLLPLTITPSDYLLLGSPAAKNPSTDYCFGIANGGSGPYGGFFIIGDTVMQNYYLVFTEDTVGWGPVNKTRCTEGHSR